jgi:hypothetical protein
MSRVGEVVITDEQVLLSISILSLAVICVPGNAFVDVWPEEIPPGWELEWVEDDE